MTEPLFIDRFDAGKKLALHLMAYAFRDDVLVLALPRGGVPVAFEVAKALHAPMDVFLVRKLGVPGQEELAMGAVASGGTMVRIDYLIRGLDISENLFDEAVTREEAELRRREREYRADRPPVQVAGLTLIIVDDGLATGSTMRAAIMALRKMKPARIVVAVPVGAASTCEEMKVIADEVVCALSPRNLFAVGYWYRNFRQTEDDEVRALLKAADLFSEAEPAHF